MPSASLARERHRVDVLAPVVSDDRDPAAVVLFDDAHHAGGAGQYGSPLWGAGLEELDHAGQAVGDVLAGDTAGVERTHRQLRPGLTDGLGRNNADRLAELDVLVGGQRTAVAAGADPVGRLAREHGPDHHLGDGRVVAKLP